MKSLKTLMRVTNNRLEEKKKQVLLYQHEKEQLLQFIEDLYIQLLKEQDCAAEQTHLQEALGHYEKYVQERRHHYEDAIANVKQKIEALQGEITEDFQSLKQYELVLEKHIKKQSETEMKRERTALDALALRKHSMRQQNKEQP